MLYGEESAPGRENAGRIIRETSRKRRQILVRPKSMHSLFFDKDYWYHVYSIYIYFIYLIRVSKGAICQLNFMKAPFDTRIMAGNKAVYASVYAGI